MDAGKLIGDECLANQKTYYSCEVTSSTLVVHLLPIQHLKGLFLSFPQLERQVTHTIHTKKAFFNQQNQREEAFTTQ